MNVSLEMDVSGAIGSGITVSLFGISGQHRGILRLAQPSGDAGTLSALSTATRIRTDRGEIAVEAMRIGDRVHSVRDGTAPVVWTGRRRVDCRRHPRLHDVWPARILPGAFAIGRPAHELFLSPDHAVFVADASGGALIPIRYLLNGATIRQLPADEVVY